MKRAKGVSLIELMVATAVLSIGILGLIGAMGGIQTSIQVSKNKTLASNLAQEKMQIIKQKDYFQVLVTSDPAYITSYSPQIPYDQGYFPPETILEGGVTYQRLTYVQVAREDSGVIVTLTPDVPDTGMRLITVTILWTLNGDNKKVQVTSILSNPNTVMTNSAFTGTVKNASTLTGIQGALVNIAENSGWRDTADSTGKYTIGLSPGNFTMMAQAPGYYSNFSIVSIAPNQTQTIDFLLTPIASGTVSGIAWLNRNLLISQIVASTVQTNGFAAQYVELYNPTTFTYTIGGSPPLVKLELQSTCPGANYVTCTDATYGVKLNYTNNTVAPNHYYLIANTSTFVVNGVTVTADAVYDDNADGYCTTAPAASNWNTSTPVKLLMPPGHNGTVWLNDQYGNMLDAVGWKHNVNPDSPNCQGSCMTMGNGFNVGEQIVRISSPAASFADIDNFGRAYDSNNNPVDMVQSSVTAGAIHTPLNSLHAPVTAITGTPAVGAVVSATDGLSVATAAYAVGSPPKAVFSLVNVATGTWTVFVSSSIWELENDTVTLTNTGSVYSFPSSTTLLNTANVNGFISGTVGNALGVPINPAISVSPNGAGSNANASITTGRYFLRVVPGMVDVTANPGNASSAYVFISSLSIPVALGAIHDGVNFNLAQGGRLSAYVTRDGVNALPGVAVSALDVNGIERDNEVTDNSGYATLINLATGTYTVQPDVGSHEASSPTFVTVNLATPGTTVFTSTYTILGAMGTIAGTVKASGQPLRTGALIVVTTNTLVGSPPVPPSLSSQTLTSSVYYVASSREDGSFSVDVRQSTNPAYNVYAYYTTYNGTTPVLSSSKTLNIPVTAGSTVSGITFAW